MAKILLAKDAFFSGVKEKGVPCVTRAGSFEVKLDINSIIPLHKGNLEEIQICEILSQYLQSAGPSGGSMKFKLYPGFKQGGLRAHLRIVHFEIMEYSPFTAFLAQVLGKDISFHAEISNFKLPWYDPFELTKIEFQEIRFGYYMCWANTICREASPLVVNLAKRERYEFSGELTLTLTVNTPPEVARKVEIIPEMLGDGLENVVYIISENGTRFKAHKCLLLAHSQLFSAFFEQSDVEGVKTSILKTQDLSEDGFRALTIYLYGWKSIEPEEKPVVAFELLCAGYKYDIPELKSSMKWLFLTKPNYWYSAEDALKLYFFAKELPEQDGHRLKLKAIQVMKGMSWGFIKMTATYATLLKENFQEAVELCSHFHT